MFLRELDCHVPPEREHYAFDESKVHRGQPGNAGQFGPGGGSAASASDAGGSNGQPDAKPADATAGQGDAQEANPDEGAAVDPPTAPPPGEYYSPDPADGQSSRVGVPAFSVPPPPAVPRLPKLAPDERQAEESFAAAYEADPDGMAGQVLAKMAAGELGDGFPNVFGTDDVKALAADWKGATPEETLDRRSQYNTALHQTANALAKRAFVRYLDETVSKLPEGQRNVLVTSGGCAAGKGYAIGKIDEVRTVAASAAAVWDAAGEANATENPWILAECQARGIKATFVFVHANPSETWENPKRGVVERANGKGRMVDARVFADSYAYGARNFAAFAQENQGNPNCEVFFLDNSQGDPQRVPTMPEPALSIDPEQLYQRSVGYLQSAENVKPAVKRGGTAGLRIWGQE